MAAVIHRFMSMVLNKRAPPNAAIRAGECGRQQ